MFRLAAPRLDHHGGILPGNLHVVFSRLVAVNMSGAGADFFD